MAFMRRALLCVCLSLPVGPLTTAAQDAGVGDLGEGKGKGEEAFKKAVDRLKSKDAVERATAANEMGRRGYRFRKEIAEMLRPMLRSDVDPVVRAAAGRALGRLGAREAVPDLIKALDDASADVRVVAAAALWRLPDPAATDPLLAHVKDQDKSVREWAALALGVIADRKAVPELVRMLGDPERSVRLAALRSLGRIGDPEGMDPLVKYLRGGKRDQEEKEEGVAAVASMKSEGRTSALLSLLEGAEGDAEQQIRVIAALGKVGSNAALTPLRKRATSGPSEVRDAANKAFAELQGRLKGGGNTSTADATVGANR